MKKGIILLIVLVVAFACVKATRPKCPAMCRTGDKSPIRCVQDTATSCRKMLQCSIDEENCRRRLMGRPRITSTSLGRCRKIKANVGSGRCAHGPRGPRDACRRLACSDNSSVLHCYRSKNNNCRLLTACQMERLNCQRGWFNAIKHVDRRRCGSAKPGRKQRCLDMPTGG